MLLEQNHRCRRAASDYLGRPETDLEVIRLAQHAATVADAAAIAWLRQMARDGPGGRELCV